MKKVTIYVIIISVVLVSVLVLIEIRNYSDINYVEIGGEKVFVEVAKTKEKRERGLMFREELCGDCGLLFVFEKEDRHGFWMKDALIPLDMIFISSDLEVVDVLHATPCTEEPCESYFPGGEALYVLEVNYGKFDEGIIGEKVRIS